MRTKNDARKAIETAARIATKITEDLTLEEKSYILGIIEGMRMNKSLHTPTDTPEKTA